MKETAICNNCGAKFDSSLSRCPYCNAIYEPGAEKDYMEDLGELKEELSELSQVPVEAYKKEISRNVKKIVIILFATAAILLLIWGVWRLVEKRLYYYPEVDVKEQIIWEEKNFPQLDAWFEEGNYEAILEFDIQESEKGYNTYNWEHSGLISAYDGYQMCMERRDVLKDKERANEGTARFVLGELMYLLFFIKEDYYPEEDWALIQSWRPDLEAILYQDMKFTKEEVQELYTAINRDGAIDYKKCDKYAEKIWKRFIE